CERVDCRTVNKRSIEALIKCGAFGSTGASRKGMLSVLEQAQAAGSKSQQDAQIGQGSIFDDIFAAADDATGAMAAFAAPQHPAIPAEEFDQPEMLAIEKESIGLFISAHPLKQVREALRLKVDCSLAELADRKDGDWVTAGGIITQAKKIRTRNGDHMMFATLDDLEGSVEVIVFGKALGEFEGALGVDSVVLVRGRVDHKEATRTSLVAQTVDPFEPTEEEVERAKKEMSTRRLGPPPLMLRLDAARLPASAIDDLKELLGSFPGESEVVLELMLSGGDPRRLRLGNAFKVAPTSTLRAELDQILGSAVVHAPASAAPTAAA
ncbi:MAG: polymerase subunit alpha, partial [Solirubrobacteraceae bacterium]|nr:polymerase subunit alpha [Solirubrobacteraceae bacterium]